MSYFHQILGEWTLQLHSNQNQTTEMLSRFCYFYEKVCFLYTIENRFPCGIKQNKCTFKHWSVANTSTYYEKGFKYWQISHTDTITCSSNNLPKTTPYFSLSFVSNTQLFPHFLTIKHSYSKRLAHTQL